MYMNVRSRKRGGMSWPSQLHPLLEPVTPRALAVTGPAFAPALRLAVGVQQVVSLATRALRLSGIRGGRGPATQHGRQHGHGVEVGTRCAGAQPAAGGRLKALW